MEFDLESQPELVQQAAGYVIQGWELAQSWLLSPEAWSQFGLLITAYLLAVFVTRWLRPRISSLLDPGDVQNMFSKPRLFVMTFLPLMLPLLAYLFTAVGEGIVRSLFDSGSVIAFGKRVFLFLAARALVKDIHQRSVPEAVWQIHLDSGGGTLCRRVAGTGPDAVKRNGWLCWGISAFR